MYEIDASKSVRGKYKRNTFIFLLIFLLFFTSPFFLDREKKVEGTQVGDVITQLGIELTVVDVNYSDKENMLSVAFSLPISAVDPLAKYTLAVKADKTTSKDLPVTMQKISQDKYVGYIKNIPPKWKKLAIELVNKGGDGSLSNSAGKIYFAHSSVPVTSQKIEQSNDYFLPKFVKTKVELLDELMADEQKEIKRLVKENGKIVTTKEELELALEEASASEKEEIANKITSLESSIKANNDRITELKTLIAEQKSEKELIQEKSKKTNSSTEKTKK